MQIIFISLKKSKAIQGEFWGNKSWKRFTLDALILNIFFFQIFIAIPRAVDSCPIFEQNVAQCQKKIFKTRTWVNNFLKHQQHENVYPGNYKKNFITNDFVFLFFLPNSATFAVELLNTVENCIVIWEFTQVGIRPFKWMSYFSLISSIFN